MASKRSIGTTNEYSVIDYLVSQGCRVVLHSFSPFHSYEVDIIAYDEGTLVFVEVKSVANKGWDESNIAHLVNNLKRDKIRKVALYFIENSLIPYKDVRFDVAFRNGSKITYYKGCSL